MEDITGLTYIFRVIDGKREWGRDTKIIIAETLPKLITDNNLGVLNESQAGLEKN